MLTASGRAHMETEVEANGSVVQLRSIPLMVSGGSAGALILLRDVTELRHRERELITKDATIREIHHRVKNNLQTVAALLRLQARRMRVPEAAAALQEAVRRVGSIALVHETLSQAQRRGRGLRRHRPADRHDGGGVVGARGPDHAGADWAVRHAVRVGGHAAGPGAHRVAAQCRAARAGPAGWPRLPGRWNWLRSRNGERLRGDRGRQRRRASRTDFDLEAATSLGLQIVRTLVVSELGGTLRASADGRRRHQRPGRNCRCRRRTRRC